MYKRQSDVVLAANAQWPFVLGAWTELFGRNPVEHTEVLRMGLMPASSGRQMIGDALPHPLSVAQALAPWIEQARDISIEGEGSPEEPLVIRTDLEGDGPKLRLEVVLEGTLEAAPRGAWLEIDGDRADRCIRTRDYGLFLRSGAKLVDLPDPLTARVEAFAGEALSRRPRPQPDRILSRRARLLSSIDATFGSNDGTT